MSQVFTRDAYTYARVCHREENSLGVGDACSVLSTQCSVFFPVVLLSYPCPHASPSTDRILLKTEVTYAANSIFTCFHRCLLSNVICLFHGNSIYQVIRNSKSNQVFASMLEFCWKAIFRHSEITRAMKILVDEQARDACDANALPQVYISVGRRVLFKNHETRKRISNKTEILRVYAILINFLWKLFRLLHHAEDAATIAAVAIPATPYPATRPALFRNSRSTWRVMKPTCPASVR